jgi:hypothetical protein
MMSRLSYAGRRDQVTAEHIENARGKCHNAVAYYATGLQDFKALVAAGAPDSGAVDYAQIADRWRRLYAHLRSCGEELTADASPGILAAIEAANAGHDTTVTLKWGGHDLFWPSAHEAASELPDMLGNATGFMDPEDKLRNNYARVVEKLAPAPEINCSWWQSRLSFEHRNAVAWIERRDATGNTDSGAIPTEHRSCGMSKTAAAKYHAGQKIENGTDYFKNHPDITVEGEGRTWYFDVRQFPKSVQEKMRG